MALASKEKLPKPNALVVVTSDTCFADPNKDLSGNYVINMLKSLDLFEDVEKLIVRDDINQIKSCIQKSLVARNPALVITVGGTGLCPRDVTPEATSSLYDKHCSGIVAAMHMASLRSTPNAALSRLTAGIIGNRCLVINFPGSQKACRDCMSTLDKFLEHALEQVRFNPDKISQTHQNIQNNAVNNDVIEKAYCTDGPRRIIPKSPQDKQQTNQRDQFDVKSTSIRFSFSPRKSSRSVFNQVIGQNSNNLETNSTQKNNLTTVKLEPFVSNNNHNGNDTNSNKKIKPKDKQPSEVQKNDDSSLKRVLHKPLQKHSPYPIIKYEQALDILKTYSNKMLNTDHVHRIDMTSQSTANRCLYHVLAEDIRPKTIVPAYAVSTMDGYVVSVPKILSKIIDQVDRIHANLVNDVHELDKIATDRGKDYGFYCYQVNTGGRLPKCDFFIVPTEKAELQSDNKVVLHEAKRGAYIRQAGSDLGPNDCLKKGTIIGPVELSLILSMGHRLVKVWRRPRIGILSTGDELVGAFTPLDLSDDSVIDVNAPLLTTLLGMYKYPATQYGIVGDDPDAITTKLKLASLSCDLIIVTGGASMGTKDWVKTVIEQRLHGKIHFGRVNIKPGKPIAFATLRRGDKMVPIFSLPGNPVSAYVTTLITVLPFLEHGLRYHLNPESPLDLKLVGDIIQVEIKKLLDVECTCKFDGRLEFARAKIIDSHSSEIGLVPVSVSMKQQSSRLMNLADFDCLLMIGSERKGKSFEVGDTYWACRPNRVM